MGKEGGMMDHCSEWAGSGHRGPPHLASTPTAWSLFPSTLVLSKSLFKIQLGHLHKAFLSEYGPLSTSHIPQSDSTGRRVEWLLWESEPHTVLPGLLRAEARLNIRFFPLFFFY